MSAHPSLLALGNRIRALGAHRAATATHLARLGLDAATEVTTLWVLERLVTRDEKLTAAASAALAALRKAGPASTPEIDALVKALGAP